MTNKISDIIGNCVGYNFIKLVLPTNWPMVLVNMEFNWYEMSNGITIELTSYINKYKQIFNKL